MAIDLASADELLATTRGVRRRLDFEKPVSRAILEECVEIALQAPVGTFRPHFLILLDPAIKKQVGDFYRRAALPYVDDLEAAVRKRKDRSGWDPDKELKTLKTARWFDSVLHQAPALVIVGGEPNVNLANVDEGRLETGSLFDQASAYGGVLPAGWSFMLAARARGLGALWTTLHLSHADEIGKLLDLPEHFSQVALLPVGYYTGSGFKLATRRPAAEAIHWDRW